MTRQAHTVTRVMIQRDILPEYANNHYLKKTLGV